MINTAKMIKIGKTLFKQSKGFIFKHRHQIVMIATTSMNVAAVVGVSANSERVAAEIQKKREEKGSEPTFVEKAGACTKVNWPWYLGIGGSSVFDILDKRDLIKDLAMSQVANRLLTNEKNGLLDSMDEDLSASKKKEVQKDANEKSEVNKSKDNGTYGRDITGIPSIGRGDQIFVLDGMMFRGDINDGDNAYKQLDRDLNNDDSPAMFRTREDLLHLWCNNAGGNWDWFMNELMPEPSNNIYESAVSAERRRGWTRYGSNGTIVSCRVESNIMGDDAPLASKFGITGVDKDKRVILLVDNSDWFTDEARQRAFEDESYY